MPRPKRGPDARKIRRAILRVTDPQTRRLVAESRSFHAMQRHAFDGLFLYFAQTVRAAITREMYDFAARARQEG